MHVFEDEVELRDGGIVEVVLEAVPQRAHQVPMPQFGYHLDVAGEAVAVGGLALFHFEGPDCHWGPIT